MAETSTQELDPVSIDAGLTGVEKIAVEDSPSRRQEEHLLTLESVLEVVEPNKPRDYRKIDQIRDYVKSLMKIIGTEIRDPVIVGLLVFTGAMATLLTLGHKSYEGIIDGTQVKYWQMVGSCRELTLEPNGLKRVIYDENDDNVLGNHPMDFVEYMLPNNVKVRYERNKVIVDSGIEKKSYTSLSKPSDIDILTASGITTVHLKPIDEVFSESTNTFNQYRNKIMPKITIP